MVISGAQTPYQILLLFFFFWFFSDLQFGNATKYHPVSQNTFTVWADMNNLNGAWILDTEVCKGCTLSGERKFAFLGCIWETLYKYLQKLHDYWHL